MKESPEDRESEVTDGSKVRFDFIEEHHMKEEIGDQNVISVEVDTHVGKLENWPEDLEKVIMARTTNRGTRVYAGNIKYNKESGVISFDVGTCVPRYITKIEERNIGTTFPDLCWLLSEGTTRQNVDQSQTKFREDAEFGDLTWLLPAKFCDDLVEAMHIMNSWILEGSLYQAIIYGPKFS